jgi:hypothetical protein
MVPTPATGERLKGNPAKLPTIAVRLRSACRGSIELEQNEKSRETHRVSCRTHMARQPMTERNSVVLRQPLGIDGRQPLAKARKEAKKIQGRLADNCDPVLEERKKQAEATDTLKAIAEEYLRRGEKKKELRSLKERSGSSSDTSSPPSSATVRSTASNALRSAVCSTRSR